MKLVILAPLLLLWPCHGNDVDKALLENTVFVVLSQPDTYHSNLAEELKDNLQTSLKLHGVEDSQILISGQDFPQHGSWTVFPVISYLANQLKLEAQWFVFLDVVSSVNLPNLSKLLVKKSSAHFIGYSLEDKIHSIIHHFSAPGALKYPNFEAGFILSGSIVKQMGLSMSEHGRRLDWIPDSFSIDPQYELASALKQRDEKHTLLHADELCFNKGEKCAIFQRDIDKTCNSSSHSVNSLLNKTLFAVKTCVKYHDSRLPIIRGTWAPAVPKIMYFSESNDTKYETVQLDGIQNTDRGHCQKTMAIINYFVENAEIEDWKWLVITDDDTILSVQKLMEYLHCFNDEKVFLGQRYGFRVASGTHGYDYITGGGGMILSQKMAQAIITSQRCQCSTPDAPDDMHLGMCLSRLGLSFVHSPRFHQARPDDYSPEQLAHQDPISFHKFWENNPHEIYDHWFRPADRSLLSGNKYSQHEEL